MTTTNDLAQRIWDVMESYATGRCIDCDPLDVADLRFALTLFKIVEQEEVKYVAINQDPP